MPVRACVPESIWFILDTRTTDDLNSNVLHNRCCYIVSQNIEQALVIHNSFSQSLRSWNLRLKPNRGDVRQSMKTTWLPSIDEMCVFASVWLRTRMLLIQLGYQNRAKLQIMKVLSYQNDGLLWFPLVLRANVKKKSIHRISQTLIKSQGLCFPSSVHSCHEVFDQRVDV